MATIGNAAGGAPALPDAAVATGGSGGADPGATGATETTPAAPEKQVFVIQICKNYWIKCPLAGRSAGAHGGCVCCRAQACRTLYMYARGAPAPMQPFPSMAAGSTTGSGHAGGCHFRSLSELRRRAQGQQVCVSQPRRRFGAWPPCAGAGAGTCGISEGCA